MLLHIQQEGAADELANSSSSLHSHGKRGQLRAGGGTCSLVNGVLGHPTKLHSSFPRGKLIHLTELGSIHRERSVDTTWNKLSCH